MMMSGLVDVVFNIEMSLVVGILTSLVLGLLLFLIKVPSTEYSRKIADTKNTIAVCYLICSLLFFINLRYSGIPDYEVFSSMIMFVITVVASVVLSYSLVTLLDTSDFDRDKFFLNIGLVAVMSYILVRSFWWESDIARNIVVGLCIVLFVFQCVIHIVVFNRTYRKSVARLEHYYDDEQDHRIRWIRFCYIMMMLTQMFVLVYLLLPHGMMKVYVGFYSLFMLYFAANFISFLGSHKLLLDAFAYKTLSGEDLKSMIHARKMRKTAGKGVEMDAGFNEREFVRIEKALDRWVKEKRYREYDRTREEIAAELNTTKEMLHLYFSTKMMVDFRTWRTQLRVEEAKRLLVENRKVSVNVVGEMAGFSDRANFYRQFVRCVGCSPKEWRENN